MLKMLRTIIDAARFARSIEQSEGLVNETAAPAIVEPQAMMQHAYKETLDHQEVIGERKRAPSEAHVEPLTATSLTELPR